MEISEREKNILEIIIKEYIRSAKPVGSEFLAGKNSLKICPATLRNEMQKLTEAGYLFQPHTSAGRIPTNKGYRFFVDSFLDSDFEENLFSSGLTDINDEEKNIFKFAESIARKMALASSGLSLVYLFEEDFLWKDGWKEVFRNPEFKEADFIGEFMETVDSFEKNIRDFVKEEKDFSGPKIFIGKEKSVLGSKDFSLLVSSGKFPDNERGLLALLGPNRMDYNKNINLLNCLIKELNNF